MHKRILSYPITYWKTASGFEVDFVLGEHEIAVEVKGTDTGIYCQDRDNFF